MMIFLWDLTDLRSRAVVSTGATGAVAPELFEELLSKNLGFLGLLKCPMN